MPLTVNLVLLSLQLALGEQTFLLVRGSGTPLEVLRVTQDQVALNWLPPGFRAAHAAASDFTALQALLPDAIGVIDLTFSSVERAMLAALCDSSEIPHIVLGYVADIAPHQWTYYVNGRKADLAAALDAVVAHFGWVKINIAIDANEQLSGVAMLLEQQIYRVYEKQDFTLNSALNVDSTVGKGMRMSGNRVSVILTEPDTTQAVVAAQYHKNIGGAGFANLMPLFSSLYSINPLISTQITGNLVLAESELAGVETLNALYTHWLSAVAQMFVNYTNPADVKKALDILLPTHQREGNYALVNLQSGKRVLIGTVKSAKVTLFSPVVFLGNTTEIPRNAKSPLPISGNFGIRNVATVSLTAHLYYHGAMLAVDQINTWTNILENFNLELFNFTAGVTVWNYNFTYNNVYPVRDKLGLAVLAGTSSGVTQQLIGFLDSLGYRGPIIGSSNTINAFSDRKVYPRFARTVLADSFINAVYLEMFRRFGWKNCGLFVSNETWGLGFRSVFSALAEQNGISILNKKEFQVLPTPIPSIDTLRNYTANFLDFINSQARVLIIVVNNNAVLLIDYLYELGIRGGDVQIVANEWLSMSLVSTNDTEINHKRSEIMRGAIQFSPVSFIGKFGTQVLQDYKAKYSTQPPVYACFFYDSALAIAYALDLVIRNGGDYMDPAVVLKSLRGSRFVGCTGTVTFDPETNDRSPMSYNVLNAQFAGNDSYITNMTTIGVYNPTSTILFRFYSDLIWCDGTTTTPLDMRFSTIGCPFEDRFNKEFAKGKYLLWGICAFIALLTAVLTAIIWRIAWNRPLEYLLEKREIEINDVIVMAGIVIELIQYLSIGPDLTFLSQGVYKFLSSTTMDIQDFITYRNGGYGMVWIGVVSSVAASILMGVVVFMHLDIKFEWIPCCKGIGDISELVIPFVGNLLFLPIISILMNAYICIKGTGIDEASIGFTDSYLSVDCYEDCWQGIHLVHVVGSSVVLLIYTPIAVVLRPLWQEIQSPLNIKTSPLYLMVKTVLQICLIVLSKTVKLTNHTAHCFIFLGFMGAFIAFSLKFPCFGYKRTQLWHVLSLIAVVWASILTVIYSLTGTDRITLFIGVLAGGWGLIGALGFAYQLIRVPSLLYRKRGVDTRPLFKFAFKPATQSILSALQKSFQEVGHRSRILDLQIQPAESAQRYVAATEDLSSRRNPIGSERMHAPIKSDGDHNRP